MYSPFLTSSVYAVWCRRTDELVDGPNASHITPSALDRWELRLEDLFKGRPFDMLDAALSDTVMKFPVDIQVSTLNCLTATIFSSAVFILAILMLKVQLKSTFQNHQPSSD